MAMNKAFVFSLCLLLVFNGCLAARQGRTSQQNQCQLNQLRAREPDNRVQAEAGQIETWNYNEDDFQCAGVAASRITIEQNGLHLPSYVNAPQLVYIVQGRGLLGLVLSGCPETYEESQEDQSQQQYQRGGRGQREQQEEQEEREREQERRRRQEQQQEQGGRRERQEGQEEERQREQERRRRQQQQQQGQRGQEEQLDRHQKVRRVREGDVVAIPAGVAYWSYNDGEQNLVAVSLLDLSNKNNQLDQNPRRFYLAGNPEDEFEQQGRSQQYRRQRGQSGQRGQRQQEDEEERRREQQESRRERERRQEQQQQSRRSQQQGGNANNVFSGFSTRLLAQALNVDEETARNLQGQDDNRNQIVRVKGQLDLVQPPRGQQQRQHEQRQEEQLERERQHAQQGGRNDLVMVNGIEETLCSARLTENLQNPERADVYTPQAGRVSTLNSHNLPILRLLRLSAERGFFYNNAIYSPHWNLNAHSVVYVLRGDARVQVVNDNGELILDDQVQEGQLFIVPQNHAVLKQAGNRGFEYIAFKTEDNAMINTLVGRTSVLRALPQEVVANAYQVSRQEARQLKYNRQETTALSSQQQRSSSERRAIA